MNDLQIIRDGASSARYLRQLVDNGCATDGETQRLMAKILAGLKRAQGRAAARGLASAEFLQARMADGMVGGGEGRRLLCAVVDAYESVCPRQGVTVRPGVSLFLVPRLQPEARP